MTASGDEFGNVCGTSSDRSSISWKSIWQATTGRKWPAACCVQRCSDVPTVGAHIVVNRPGFGSGVVFIGAMYSICNLNAALNYSPRKYPGTLKGNRVLAARPNADVRGGRYNVYD